MAHGEFIPSFGGDRAAVFATTHWSMVMLAGQEHSPAATAALEKLCHAYWYPIYAEVRRRGYGQHDAQDHTQGFFAGLLRRKSFTHVAAEKGRFRTFLLASLKNFLADQHDLRQAAKRGGGTPLIELDAMTAEHRFALEPATEETPDKAFDRRWATALLEQAFARLASEQAQAGKGEIFSRLKTFLTRETEPGEYGELASELGLTANAIAQTVRRLRWRARELLIDEAAQTVAAVGDAEQELRALFG